MSASTETAKPLNKDSQNEISPNISINRTVGTNRIAMSQRNMIEAIAIIKIHVNDLPYNKVIYLISNCFSFPVSEI